MAIARLSVKVGKAGKAAPHADYIAREGPYANRLERGETLEAKEAGNMPAWAAESPGRFWHAADAFERANGTTYRELELSLPRELTADDRAALVRAFVAQEIGERHPYQWAIHRPKAADGKDQPHAHLMFSERRQDGIERDPDQFFKRWNAKAPEKGGAHKRFGEVDGPNRSQAQRAADLRALRGRWGEMVNSHLERAGVGERIDMRSLKAQGIDRAPEKKQTPRAWRDPQQRATVLEYRQIHRDRDQAAAEFRAVVPDGHVVDLEAHAAKLEAIRAEIQTKAPTIEPPTAAPVPAATMEVQRGELIDHGAAPYRRQPDAARSYFVSLRATDGKLHTHWGVGLESAMEQAGAMVGDQVTLAQTGKVPVTMTDANGNEKTIQKNVWAVEINDRPKAPEQPQTSGRPGRRNYGTIPPEPKDPEQVYADLLKPILERTQAATHATLAAVSVEREAYREASRAHYYSEPTGIVSKALRKAKWDRDGDALAAQGGPLREREEAARLAAEPAAIERAAVAELSRVAPAVVAAAEAARKERQAREQERQRKEQAARDAEKERTAVGDAFAKLAERREDRDFSFRDGASKWKATPAALKERIEEFNSLPKHERPAALERINRDPATREQLKGLMVEREQAIKGRGQSR